MGLEIIEEFRPITPIRTVLAARTLKQAKELPDLETTKEQNEEEEECHTPTSPSQKLRTPLVCPPAPKKPRVLVPRRNNNVLAPASKRFFQVPHDLASVFVLRTPN